MPTDLFLVLAVVTLFFTSVGVAVVKIKARRWVDTHWDRGLSYLQIGWRWLRQQFRRGWPWLPPFRWTRPLTQNRQSLPASMPDILGDVGLWLTEAVREQSQKC